MSAYSSPSPSATAMTGTEIIGLRHDEWRENQKRWRWLADSREGGERYRNADYYSDPTRPALPPFWRGQIDTATGVATNIAYGATVERNLVPHRRETSPEGAKAYAMRLALTPVPSTLPKTLRRHLSRVFAGEVTREGPPALERWWADVDGSRTPIDKWVRKTVAPLFLALGQIDLLFYRPPAEAASVRSKADERALGLDRVHATFVLPENVLWWTLDPTTRRYREVLVHEPHCESHGGRVYRLWTDQYCLALDARGERIASESFRHGLGFCPLIRVFDERRPRSTNVGESRYEPIAELQKAIYNGRSELVLGDVSHAHGTLQGPEDYIGESGDIQVGAQGVLPMKRDAEGKYVGWSYVESSKKEQDTVRQHILDDEDRALSEAALLKPAGQTTQGSVGQSGIAKLADLGDQMDLLAEIAETLADLERTAAEYVLAVDLGRPPTPDELAAVTIAYPREFGLDTVADVANAVDVVQTAIAKAGQLPETETELITRLVASALPGLADQRFDQLRAEVAATVKAKSQAPAPVTPPVSQSSTNPDATAV